MKLHRIVDRLSVRGRFYRYDFDQKKAFLDAHKVDTVVCLIRNYDYDIPRMVRYIHAPLADNQFVTRPKGAAIVDSLGRVVAQDVERGRHVLVHCAAGRNRACLVAGAALLWLGFDGVDALRYIREGRPNALGNVWFEEWLVSQKARHLTG